MFRAAFLAGVLFLLNSAAGAQISHENPTQQGSIAGLVTTGQSATAVNARIDVRDLMTGSLITATYTNESGAFEVDNLAYGSYEIRATAGLSEAREQVQLRTLQTTVNLRLDVQQQPADAGSKNTVSVSDFKIPAKARDAYRKAEQAAQSLKIDEAMAHIAMALKAYPRYAAAITLRGIVHMDKKAMPDAVSDFEQAIQFDPAYPTAYLGLGAAYNSMSRFDDAIRTIDRGIALSPNSWQAYFEMGKAYVGKGDFPSALNQLNKAEDMAPEDFPRVHLVKAHALLGLKDYSQAMLELQSYLTKHPQGPESDAARKTLDQVRAFSMHNNQ